MINKEYECIYLDMDGVIVDFTGGVLDKLSITRDKYEQGKQAPWNITEYLGLDYNEFWGSLTSDFWANLKPTPWKDGILTLLDNYVGIENVFLLTTPCPITTGDCAKGKIEWIDQYVPELRDRIIITEHKEHCASSFKLLIDDNDKNCDKFRSEGGDAHLFARPWNDKWQLLDPLSDLKDYTEFDLSVIDIPKIDYLPRGGLFRDIRK